MRSWLLNARLEEVLWKAVAAGLLPRVLRRSVQRPAIAFEEAHQWTTKEYADCDEVKPMDPMVQLLLTAGGARRKSVGFGRREFVEADRNVELIAAAEMGCATKRHR